MTRGSTGSPICIEEKSSLNRAAECSEWLLAPKINDPQFDEMRAPRGRPPCGFRWDSAAGWVDDVNGKPRDADRALEAAAQARRAYDTKRYWDVRTKVRKRRLERSARERGKAPRLVQLRLDDLHAASESPERARQVKNYCVRTPERCVRPEVNHSTGFCLQTNTGHTPNP